MGIVYEQLTLVFVLLTIKKSENRGGENHKAMMENWFDVVYVALELGEYLNKLQFFSFGIWAASSPVIISELY